MGKPFACLQETQRIELPHGGAHVLQFVAHWDLPDARGTAFWADRHGASLEAGDDVRTGEVDLNGKHLPELAPRPDACSVIMVSTSTWLSCVRETLQRRTMHLLSSAPVGSKALERAATAMSSTRLIPLDEYTGVHEGPFPVAADEHGVGAMDGRATAARVIQ